MFGFRCRMAAISMLLISICTLLQAARFTVSTLSDENDGPAGSGLSLRDAITSANASAGPHVIDFAPALTSGGPATISLTSGSLPALAQEISLTGPGRDLLSVSGNNKVRVLDIRPDTTVTITGLTVRDGVTSTIGTDISGGGIRVLGSLIMDSCRVTSNTAIVGGGIDVPSTGVLTITQSEVSGNRSTESGGIRHTSSAPIVITDCVITSNTANQITGGLDLFASTGTVNIARCTVSHNLSLSVAGGIYLAQPGFITDSTIEDNTANLNIAGGIYMEAAAITISNTTITSNTARSAGGGIYSNVSVSTVTLQNVTITSNTAFGPDNGGEGGGIYSTNLRLRLSNCVVAGNTDGTSQGLLFPDVFGHIVSLGHNFIGDTGTTAVLVNGINGDQVGYTTAPLTALLGPLANNGGPTLTQHPMPGSPLIDAGDSSGVTTATMDGPPFTDQRGAPRIRGLAVDIGAVEVQPPPIANPDLYAALEDTATTVAAPGVLANDAFVATAELVSDASHGNVALNADGSFVYTPAANFNGDDTFTYRAINAVDQASSPALVTITVSPVNDAPIITVPGAKIVAEDTQLNIAGVSVNDLDGSTITVSLNVSHGTLTLTNGAVAVAGNGTSSLSTTGTLAAVNARLFNIRYQGTLNYNGPDLLLVQADDLGNTGIGGAKTDSKSIGITVTPVSDAHLTIQKSATALVSDAGSTITYTILVTNTGTELTLGNVVIQDPPPVGLVLVSATSTAGAVTTSGLVVPPFYELVDTVAPLAPSATETFTLVFTVDGTGTYENTARATSPEGTVSDSVTVNLCPAASFAPAGDCSALPDLKAAWTTPPVLAKGKLKGKALVTNQGSADALNATMVIVLSNDACPGSSDQILSTKLLKKLKPGKSKKVNLSYKLADPATVSGKLVIFSVDGTNGVPECNESNNFAGVGPLP